jgi:hypothetical protein
MFVNNMLLKLGDLRHLDIMFGNIILYLNIKQK